MGKRTPFEGELDAFGNPMCGQSFMAGTICSRPPKHDGFCGAECQNCGGDWINGTCECIADVCSECDRDLKIEEEIEEGVCAECMLASTEPSQNCILCLEPIQFTEAGQAGTYYWHHVDTRPGTHGCHGADERHNKALGSGPTPKELAEAYRSLGVELPRCANCMEPLIWHEGNGGQWLGADPPRDWTTCRGVPDGLKHAPPM